MSSDAPPSSAPAEGGRAEGRKGPPDLAGLFSVKVDNLSYDTTADDIKPIFEKYGRVADVSGSARTPTSPASTNAPRRLTEPPRPRAPALPRPRAPAASPP